MTQRLIGLASRYWPVLDGMMVGASGIDPLELPIDRFLNLVYWWATDDREQDEIDKFDTRLWMPPAGVEAKTGPWSVEAETGAFKALKAALAQKTPSPGQPVVQ